MLQDGEQHPHESLMTHQLLESHVPLESSTVLTLFTVRFPTFNKNLPFSSVMNKYTLLGYVRDNAIKVQVHIIMNTH